MYQCELCNGYYRFLVVRQYLNVSLLSNFSSQLRMLSFAIRDFIFVELIWLIVMYKIRSPRADPGRGSVVLYHILVYLQLANKEFLLVLYTSLFI